MKRQKEKEKEKEKYGDMVWLDEDYIPNGSNTDLTQEENEILEECLNNSEK